MKLFKEGKSYNAMLGNDVRAEVKIIKRTAKFATVEHHGRQERKKIEIKNDSEYLRMLWSGVYASNPA